MRKIDKKLLNGLALGDGYIGVRGNSYRLCITHCDKQKGYIEHKARLLSKALNRNVTCRRFNNSGFIAWRLEISHPYLRFVHSWLYKNGKKKVSLSFLRKLSDESVAHWYMDDGSLVAKKHNGKIHAYDLTFSMYVSESEANDAISFFKERYDVNFTLKRNKGLFSIRCGTRNAKKLLSVLKPFSCNCMEYKFFD